MRPLGRKFYKNKTGGKHHVKINGKYHAWWLDVIDASRKRSRQEVKKEIKEATE